jgi:hypothetical protein
MDSGHMNDIIKPVTPDGDAGYDSFGQFWVYRYDPRDSSNRIGSIFVDLRGKTCLLCAQEWKCTAPDLADQIYVRDAEVHVHKSCYERYLTLQNRAEWVKAIYESGLHDMMETFTAVPNQYGGAWNTPWYAVTLKGGNAPILTFGARKRVDSITIRRLTQEQVAYLTEAFKNEESTKGPDGTDGFMIHSWGVTKTVEYLKHIVTMLNEKAVPVREDPTCRVTTFKSRQKLEDAKA